MNNLLATVRVAEPEAPEHSCDSHGKISLSKWTAWLPEYLFFLSFSVLYRYLCMPQVLEVNHLHKQELHSLTEQSEQIWYLGGGPLRDGS